MLTYTYLSNYFSGRMFLNKRLYCAPSFSPSARKAHFLYPARKGYCQNVQSNPITCFLVPWSFSGVLRLFYTLFKSEVSHLLLILGCCVTTEAEEIEGGLKHNFSWMTLCLEVCVYLCFVLSLETRKHFWRIFLFSLLCSPENGNRRRDDNNVTHLNTCE